MVTRLTAPEGGFIGTRQTDKNVQQPKTKDTKTALVEAAEKLIAENGFGNVSLKMITKAAGARNTSAVQYHFGSIESLIREVFTERFHDIERERTRRLAEVPAEHSSKHERLIDLMVAALGALFDTCHEEAGRTYVRFALQYLTDPRFNITETIAQDPPGSVGVLREEVLKCLSEIPPQERITRMRQSLLMSMMQAVDYSKKVETGTAPQPEKAVRAAALSLAAFLMAPVE